MATVNTYGGIACVDSGTSISTTEYAVGQQGASTTRASVVLASTFADQYLDGHEMILRVAWEATTAGSYTFQPTIRYYGLRSNTNLTTFDASDIVMAQPTAPTIGTATQILQINMKFRWDLALQTINGAYEFMTGNTWTAWAALTNQVTSVAHANAIGFYVTGKFGTSSTNHFTVKCFELDWI
jgi:hypothetical protein